MKLEYKFENKNLCILLLISIFLIFFQILNEEMSKIVFIIQLPLIFIYLLTTFKNQKDNFLILLFLICNIVFLYGKVYIKIIKNEKLIGMFFNKCIFSTETFLEMIKVCNYNLLGITLGIFLYKFYSIHFKKNKESTNIDISNNMFYIFLILGIISITLAYNLSKIVNINGYLSLFNNTAKQNFGYLKNSILFLSSNFFVALFFILLSDIKKIKSKKYYIVIFILFFIFRFCENLSGGRGRTIGCLLFILWYSFKFLNLKINLFKLMVIGFLSISLCFYFSSRRNIKNKENFRIIRIEKIFDFLDEQGGSLSLLGYYIDNKEKLDIESRPMICSFILGGPEKILCKLTKQNYNPRESFYNGERISSVINPHLYQSGFGTGGNYLVEMYDLGRKTGVILWTTLLIFFMYYIQEQFIYMTLLKRMFVLYYIYSIFLLPRAHYLAIGITGSIFLIVVYLIIIFTRYLKQKFNGRVL